MARIPRVGIGNTQLSNPKLTTESGQAMQTQAIGEGRGIEALGGAVEKSANYLYQKMDEARNYVESSQFELIQSKKAQVRQKYALATTTDSDGRVWSATNTPENREALERDLRAIDDESFKVFTNKEQEAMARATAQKINMTIKLDVQSDWMKNVARNGQAATGIYYDAIATTFKGTPEEIKAINDRANLDIANNISTPEQAYKDAQATIKKGWNNMYLTDLKDNPKLAGERLDAKFYGFDVVETEKARAIYDREIKKIQNDTADAIIKDELNGKPHSVDEIIDLMNLGKIDTGWAESKIKNLTTIKKVETVPSVYKEIKDMIVGGAKASEINNKIEAARNVTLSNSDADTLYYVKQEGKDTSVYQAHYDETHKQDSWWTVAINSISNFVQSAYGVASPILPGLINKFVTQVKTKNSAKEEFPDIALQVIKAKVIEDNPSISNLKDVPNAKFNKDGFQPLLEGKNEAEANYVFRGGKLVPNKKTE